MARPLSQLQQSIKNLREQITDILHLAQLNKQSIMCLNHEEKTPFKEIVMNSYDQKPFKNIEQNCSQEQNFNLWKLKNQVFGQKFDQISTLFQKRSEHHLNFLISKQITWQEDSVRRDRLNQYEDRIYDQRRLISDKEVFCQNLLRPRKKRPQHFSPEDFQQLRNIQKVIEQKQKLNCLQEQIRNLASLHKRFDCDSKISKRLPDSQVIKRQKTQLYKVKKADLEKTKANSLEIVNSTTNNITIERVEVQKNIDEEEQNIGQVTPPLQNSKKQVKLLKVDETRLKEGQKGKKYLILQSSPTKTILKIFQNSQRDVSPPEKIQQKLNQITSTLQRILQARVKKAAQFQQLRELKEENGHMQQHLYKLKDFYSLSTKV